MMVLWHNKCQLTRHTCTLGHIQLFMLMAMREGGHKRNWSQKEIFNDLRSVTEARLAEEDGWFLRWTWLERLRPRAAIPGLRGSFNCTLGTTSIEPRSPPRIKTLRSVSYSRHTRFSGGQKCLFSRGSLHCDLPPNWVWEGPAGSRECQHYLACLNHCPPLTHHHCAFNNVMS